jgi:hypothetical protein
MWVTTVLNEQRKLLGNEKQYSPFPLHKKFERGFYVSPA